MSEEEIIEELRKAVLNYDDEAAEKLAEEAVKKNIDFLKAIKEGPVKGITELGEKYSTKEIFLPELMVGANACIIATNILKTQIKAKKEMKSLGKIVIGTVEGDIHFIGKNLVATMLEASGFDVYDIGEDQPVANFIDKAREVNADVVGASALITTAREEQEKLANALRTSGLNVKYIVGGAVVDPAWTEIIGADGFANNMVDAVALAKRLAESD
jgi:methanogenic corrinoid protein MtbC1